MSEIKHFILTRFNLRGPTGDKNKVQTWNNPDWLAHRINLFDLYCFPSIQSQYNQNFQWLVGFDAETNPDVYKKYQSYNNFVPILVGEGVDGGDATFNQLAIQYIKDKVDLNETKIVITTRIDSDDGFSRKATRVIQDYAQKNLPVVVDDKFEPSRVALDFHRGLYLNEKTGKLIPEFISFTSAYGSLIEYFLKEIDKTVTSFSQGGLTLENPTIHVRDSQPLWLRVIHTRNVLNDRMFQVDHHRHIDEEHFSYLDLEYRRQLNQIVGKKKEKSGQNSRTRIQTQTRFKKKLSRRNPGIGRRT